MWPEHGASLASAPVGIATLVLLALAALASIGRAALAWMRAWAGRGRAYAAERMSLFEAEFAPPVSVIVTARDEERTIVARVRALLDLHYPELEVVVVNSGSEDGTLEALGEAFALRGVRRTSRAPLHGARVRGVLGSAARESLVVLDVLRSPQAESLNAGLSFARHPLVIALGPGEWLEPDALLHLALPFYEDEHVVQVSGVARIGEFRPGREPELPRGLFGRLQALEALRGLQAGRPDSSASGRLLAPVEPPTLLSREAALEAGGFREGVAGPRYDLHDRVRRRTRRRGALRLAAQAVAWTAAAPNLPALSERRIERSRAIAEPLRRPAEPARGVLDIAWRALELGAFLATEFAVPTLELLGLAVLATGFVLGGSDVGFVVMFTAIAVVGGTVPALFSLAQERALAPRLAGREEIEALAFDALVQVLGYRQLTTLWRVLGVGSALLDRGPRAAAAASARTAAAANAPRPASRSAA